MLPPGVYRHLEVFVNIIRTRLSGSEFSVPACLGATAVDEFLYHQPITTAGLKTFAVDPGLGQRLESSNPAIVKEFGVQRFVALLHPIGKVGVPDLD
jgi:hypothetical protein